MLSVIAITFGWHKNLYSSKIALVLYIAMDYLQKRCSCKRNCEMNKLKDNYLWILLLRNFDMYMHLKQNKNLKFGKFW